MIPSESDCIALVSGGGYVSGKEVISLELANGLRAAGYNLKMVISLWTNGEFPRRLQQLGHSFTKMRLGYISATPRGREMKMTAHQLIYLPRLWFTYWRFLKRTKPRRIIHTNWHHLILLMPFLRPDRDIFWIHEMIPNRSRYRQLFSVFSRRLETFVAVSEAVAKSIISLGVSPRRVKVIHNGISHFSVNSRPRERSALRIGIVGQIGPWKGHEDLCIAFSGLAESYAGCELHIFGADTGDYVDHLRRLIKQLNIESRVHWRGFEHDRGQIYSQIDICVVPSRFEEPLGLVAVEAAIAGLPCIATRRGGLPEVIKEGETGLLVEALDPPALRNAMEVLVSNPSLRAKMGEAAKQRVRHLFSREQMISGFAVLLGKC